MRGAYHMQSVKFKDYGPSVEGGTHSTPYYLLKGKKIYLKNNALGLSETIQCRKDEKNEKYSIINLCSPL